MHAGVQRLRQISTEADGLDFDPNTRCCQWPLQSEDSDGRSWSPSLCPLKPCCCLRSEDRASCRRCGHPLQLLQQVYNNNKTSTLRAFSLHETWAICTFTGRHSHTQELSACMKRGQSAPLQENGHTQTQSFQLAQCVSNPAPQSLQENMVPLKAFSLHEVWVTCTFTGKWSHSKLSACMRCG